VPIDTARELLTDKGFEEQSGDSKHATFTRDGTWFTTSGDKIPVELAIAETDTGLVSHLRYRSFVLFDTGDLDQFGDEIAELLRAENA
jgi:hypothetical protein